MIALQTSRLWQNLEVVASSAFLATSAVIKTVEFKKTVERIPAEKVKIPLYEIPAEKFQSKNSGMNSSRKTLELYQTGSKSMNK